MVSKFRNIHKTIYVLLGIIILTLLYKTFLDNNKIKALKQAYIYENKKNTQELNKLVEKYDSISSLYNSLDDNIAFITENSNLDELQIDRNRLKQLLSSNKINLDSLKILKNEIKILNKFIKKEISKNETNNKPILENVAIKGVKVVRKNKNMKQYSRLEQFRVCFSLMKPISKESLYVQIINPNNIVFSPKNKIVDYKDFKLKYTKKIYLKKTDDNDYCEFVSLDQKNTSKGNYIINIFEGSEKIHSSTFNYQ